MQSIGFHQCPWPPSGSFQKCTVILSYSQCWVRRADPSVVPQLLETPWGNQRWLLPRKRHHPPLPLWGCPTPSLSSCPSQQLWPKQSGKTNDMNFKLRWNCIDSTLILNQHKRSSSPPKLLFPIDYSPHRDLGSVIFLFFKMNPHWFQVGK